MGLDCGIRKSRVLDPGTEQQTISFREDFFLLQSPNPPFQRLLHINFYQESMGYGLLLLLNYL